MLNKISKFFIAVGFVALAASPLLVFAQANPIGGPLQLPIPGVNEPASKPATTTTTNTTTDTTKPPVQKPTELPVYNAGVDRSIQDYLCTPSSPADGQDLQRCVNRLYRFGISAGALVVVFLIIYAGYIYITSDEAGKTKAKGYLKNSLTGMAIMLGSFVLLNFINPSLVAFKPIQPPIFSAAALPTCEELGFADNCLVASGGSSQGNYSGSGNGSIVEIAMREVGNGEPTNNNRGPNIDKYFKGCSAGPGNYWCACFATWVYRQAGLGKTMDAMPNTAGTLAINAWAKGKNGQAVPDGKLVWVSPADALGGAPILPGDIVLWERGGPNDSAGHTFIAVGYDPGTKTIASVEGNVSGDKVKKLSNKVIKAGDFLGAMRIVK